MATLPYRLYGGATRPDALQFNPAFNDALLSLYAAAPPEVQRELGLTSGFRDRATQERLFNASDKTGHSVARPGHSRHESGNAADLYGFGLKGGGDVSEATKAWVHANAGAHGLAFPMSYEPWHVQLQGDGGGAAPAAPAGSVGATLASAVDPRAALMAQMENNPWKSITDTAPRRGGLVGEGSAGGGLSAPPDADPGIPLLETASANAMPDPLATDPLAAQPGSMTNQLGSLAKLFKVRPIGQPDSGQALPVRRS